MTTKDYKILAGVLREHRTAKSQLGNGPLADAYWQCRDDIAAGLANALAKDNPRFNRDTFLAACGVKTAKRKFTVIGFYPESGQRWAECFDAVDAEDAERQTPEDIHVAGVVEGEHNMADTTYFWVRAGGE